jgi:hypothetical protein
MEGSTGNLHDFPINPANTDPIYWGDLVNFNGGYVEEATGAANNNDFDILGVFQGCKYVEAGGSFRFARMWNGQVGATQIMAQIALPAGATFLIRGTDGQTYTAADIGRRKGVVYAAGVPATGQSRVTLGAAGATVATGPLRVLGQVDLPDGIPDASLAPWFEVAIIRSVLGTAAAA